MNVDILFFEGCPNHEPALEFLHEVIADLGIDAVLNHVEVRTSDDVERLGFLGSPTIRVNGEDIEPERRGDTNFAMSCRRYGNTGVPSRALLEAALTTGNQS
jgi:hypothetical protein